MAERLDFECFDFKYEICTCVANFPQEVLLNHCPRCKKPIEKKTDRDSGRFVE